MAKANTTQSEPRKGHPKLKKLMPYAAGLILVIVIGLTGFILGGGLRKKTAAAPQTVTDEIVADAGGEKPPAAKEAATKGEGGKDAAAKNAKSTKETLTYHFEEFGSNLYDPTTHWFVKMMVLAEATSPASYKKIEENVAPLREAIYFLLSTKTREELNAPESKERLKVELRKLFEGKLGQGVIADVYTDNVVVFRQ